MRLSWLPCVRYARGPLLYPLLLAGGAAASALAGLAAGNSPIFCVALFAANIVEVVTALALLKLFRVEASNLTSLRNLLIFIAMWRHCTDRKHDHCDDGIS